MYKWKFYTGLILLLLSFTSALGIVLIPALTFAGPLLVITAILGGFLVTSATGISRGWKLWAGVILVLVALLPSIGIILIPALVFTGPLLVAVAALGGYIIAGPHRHY